MASAADRGPLRGFWYAVAVALLFAFSHILWLWPVWASPWSRIPGENGDNLVMLWNIGWVWYALDHGQTGFVTKSIFYPDGLFFLYSTHTYLDALLGYGAHLANPRSESTLVLWYNISQLLATTLTGTLTTLGLRYYGVRHRGAALAGAALVTFCWFRTFASSGHQHFFATQWSVAALAMLGLALRQPRAAAWKRSPLPYHAAAGALNGIGFLSDQTLTIFTLILAFIAYAAHWPKVRRRLIAPATLYCAGFLALSLPHLGPTLHALTMGYVDYIIPTLDAYRVTDISSVLLPPDNHALLGGIAHHLRTAIGGRSVCDPYFGSVHLVFLVAGAALVWRSGAGRRRLRAAFAGTVIFLVFAFGERLTLGAHQVPIPLPGFVLRYLPVINNIRMPYRYLWPATLFAGWLAALTLQYWLGRKPRSLQRVAVAGVFLFCLLDARWRNLLTTDLTGDPILTPPGVVEAVRSQHKGGSVMTLPGWDMFRPMRLQMAWGYDIPLASGYVARLPRNGALPRRDQQFTHEVATWMREHNVGTVLLMASDPADLWTNWITAAKKEFPELVVIEERTTSDPWAGKGANFDRSRWK